MFDMRRLLPSLERLRECSVQDFEEARSEVLVVVFSALLPIWLGLLLAFVSLKFDALWSFLKAYATTGDALLTSCALVGPLIYILWKRYGKLPKDLTIRFPYGRGLTASVLAIWVVAGSVFGYSRYSALFASNSALPVPNGTIMSILSILVLGSSILLLFLATVLRNNMETLDGAELMRLSESTFVENWKHDGN